MREILFKAKRIDNGKWEAGYYEKKIAWHHIVDEYVKTEKHYICVNMVSSEDSYIDRIEVKPETICQYTGLKDKSGKMIWEGDVVLVGGIDRAFVIFSEKYSGYILEPIGDFYFDSPMLAANVDIIDSIIGNIFNNPELLEGGE